MIDRPNILFIMTDQLRYDQLGITNLVLKTPHLDRLARESVHFTRAYATNPVCVPARAGIVTGRYPSQTGVPHNATCLPAHERTVMALLRDAGYHTAVIGKQHFNGSHIDRGYVFEDIVDSHAPAEIIDGSGDSYQRFLHEHGFRQRKELCEPLDDVVNRWLVDQRFHVDHYIGEQSIAWLREDRPTDKPWYCCLSFPGPHGPVDGCGLPQQKLYPLDEIDLPAAGIDDLRAKPSYYFRTSTSGGRPKLDPMPDEQLCRIRQAWYANISLIDDQVGRILDTLRELCEYDRTLIVFSTDHGDFTGDFNLVDKGPYLLDPLMHIPLFIKPPIAGFSGREESALVSSIDFAATWLTAAGVPVPVSMRSHDLSAYWDDSHQHPDRHHVFMEAGSLRGIRTERWKLIYCQRTHEGELYDLETDPFECHNLWADPAHQLLKHELICQLIDTMIDLGENSHLAWSQSPR